VNRFSRTRQDHRQETAEDYVELIAFLIQEKGEARVVDMAERLGVSQVTVSKTVKRLAREGLVKSEPYRSIFLTERGDAMAQEAEERHRTVLRFLRRLGISEATAQADVEGIEHHVSPETLKAMKAFAEAGER
jgi:DtxR family manganese transport transcriptional regulator